ncbi:putative pentatricopeptide repeat-containing protein isoform X1 [Iris pallida]|uniref:Pentatricopeptide repeat-containing protein isoform X1 n=1 Tax=Iris pallida TaxID=29817 RepID=A0AAX6E3D5_IRIPA|nr:putative pentatricopeptide repeat-containing protein isoform X1 [Iris pallida]
MTSPSSTLSSNLTSSSTTPSSRPTPTIGLPLSVSLFLLHRMRRHHQPPPHPDKYTFTSFFKLSALGSKFPFGSSLHCVTIRYGLDSSVFIRTALIDFYGKCREIGSAQKLFDKMPHQN